MYVLVRTRCPFSQKINTCIKGSGARFVEKPSFASRVKKIPFAFIGVLIIILLTERGIVFLDNHFILRRKVGTGATFIKVAPVPTFPAFQRGEDMGTRSTIFLRMIFLLAFIFLINPMAPAASDQPLIYLSGQTTFYAGQEVTLQWQQGARDSWQDIDRLNARLVYANKTILQQNLKPFFPLKFTFVYPELRDAISVDPVLVITASQRWASTRRGVSTAVILLFPLNTTLAQSFRPKAWASLTRPKIISWPASWMGWESRIPR